MKLAIEVSTIIKFYHKLTLRPLSINKTTKQVIDEKSEEFNNVIETYKDVIGFNREENAKEFDKELLECLRDDAVREQTKSIATIDDYMRQAYSGDLKGGHLSYNGTTICITDFCAHSVEEFKINVYKTN